MRGVLAALVLFSLCASGADKKKKPPEVQVIETYAQRTEGTIALDGRVRNASEKPIVKLIIIFDILAPGNKVISTQKYTVDEEVLEPGKDALFRVKMQDHVRAVSYQFAAADEAGHDFRVGNAGPFVIE